MEASKIAKKCLANELLENKNELKFFREKKQRSKSEKRKLKLKRKVIHVLIFIYIVGSFAAISCSDLIIKSKSFLAQYLAPILVVVVKKIGPIIFKCLAKCEQYDERTALLIGILRNATLNVAAPFGLVFGEMLKKSSEDGSTLCSDDNSLCWETRVGQKLYTLAIIGFYSFIPETIMIFFGHFLGRIPKSSLFAKRCPRIANVIDDKIFEATLFKSNSQVLKIVSLQTTCWMGMLLCPMLPLITAVTCIVRIGWNMAYYIHGRTFCLLGVKNRR